MCPTLNLWFLTIQFQFNTTLNLYLLVQRRSYENNSHPILLVLFVFWKKNTYKMGSRCVCVCVCVSVCVCVCVCVQFRSPPINFQTSYPIDTKFWPHIVSYRNSPTPLILFLNFQNCAWEKFLKFIFLHFINIGKFQTHIMPLIYDLAH